MLHACAENYVCVIILMRDKTLGLVNLNRSKPPNDHQRRDGRYCLLIDDKLSMY